MSVKLRNVLYLLGSACILLPLYSLCHESGHMLVALFCGAKITNFSIIGASVSSVGGNYNTVTQGLMYSAGTLLPAIISIVYMCLYKREKKSIFYRMFSLLLVMAFSVPSATWIWVSVLYMMGKAPVGDDVTKFLDATAMNPVILIFITALLLVLSLIFAWRRGIFSNYWEELNRDKKK